MNLKKLIPLALCAFLIVACSGKSDSSTSNDSAESTKKTSELDETTDNVETDEKPVVEVISFDEKSSFKISTKSAGMNSATGEQDLEVFVNHELLNGPIKITKDHAYSKVAAGTNGVPKDAVFAFSTWFAGGGSVYYGVVKNGVLQINVKHEDEGMSSAGSYSIFREIDPNVQTKTPDYYISYSSDDKTSKELMIAFTENGKALFAKYYGQSRQLELKFTKDESKGKNLVMYYDEILGGEVVGTYKLTHSGNYDYAEYTRKKDAKKFGFTINHAVTIMNDAYRTVPSL